MGTEKLPKLIAYMAMPAIFSMFIQSMYNIVDSYFVSRISEPAFRAVTIAMPMQQLLTAVAVGTAVGVTSLIARSLGARDQTTANQTASHGVFLSAVNWLVFFVLAAFFSKVFYAAFTDHPDVYREGVRYLQIVLGASGGIILLIMVEKMLQGTGDMIKPMITQLLGAVLNIVLDPVLIFGLGPFPALGVSGAALATVLSQWISCGVALILLYRSRHKLQLTLHGFRPQKEILKGIYRVGLPSILIISITSFMIMALNQLLRRVSEQMISVLGVYFRLQSFIFMPIFGLTQGLMPIMGYNYGARNKKRLTGALKIGIGVSLAIMSLGVLLFQTQAASFLQLFQATPTMFEIGVPALRIISLSFWFAGTNLCLSTFFQAVGRGTYSLLLSVCRQFLFIVPPVFFLRFVSMEATWATFLFAEAASLIVAYWLYRKVSRTFPGKQSL